MWRAARTNVHGAVQVIAVHHAEGRVRRQRRHLAASNPPHPASPMSAVSQKSSSGTSYVNM